MRTGHDEATQSLRPRARTFQPAAHRLAVVERDHGSESDAMSRPPSMRANSGATSSNLRLPPMTRVATCGVRAAATPWQPAARRDIAIDASSMTSIGAGSADLSRRQHDASGRYHFRRLTPAGARHRRGVNRLPGCVHRGTRRRGSRANDAGECASIVAGSRPSSRRLPSACRCRRSRRPRGWGRVGLGVGQAGDPMFAHALRPMHQSCVGLRGRRFGLDVLDRQQVPADGLSGLERRGGRVDPGRVQRKSAAVGGRIGELGTPCERMQRAKPSPSCWA